MSFNKPKQSSEKPPTPETLKIFQCTFVEDLNLDLGMVVPAVVLNIFDKEFTIITVPKSFSHSINSAENDTMSTSRQSLLNSINAIDDLINLLFSFGVRDVFKYSLTRNSIDIKTFLTDKSKQEIRDLQKQIKNYPDYIPEVIKNNLSAIVFGILMNKSED